MQSLTHTETIDLFLQRVFQNDLVGALDLCDDDVKFTIFRHQTDEHVAIYGSHIGKTAGITLFENLAKMLEFGDFEVECSIAADNHVIRYGRLAHVVVQTAQPFNSLWTLIVRFNKAGKIILYRMHEDTAALEAAMQLSVRSLQ